MAAFRAMIARQLRGGDDDLVKTAQARRLTRSVSAAKERGVSRDATRMTAPEPAKMYGAGSRRNVCFYFLTSFIYRAFLDPAVQRRGLTEPARGPRLGTRDRAIAAGNPRGRGASRGRSRSYRPRGRDSPSGLRAAATQWLCRPRRFSRQPGSPCPVGRPVSRARRGSPRSRRRTHRFFS